jgi:hypothetical protein
MRKISSRQLGWVAGCVVLWGMISSSAGANLIKNGDFENGATGWTVNTGVESGAVLAVNKEEQSPFSSGSAAFQMTDGMENPSQYIIKDFGAQRDGQYVLSFDYKITAENNAHWLGRIRGTTTPETSFDFKIGGTYLEVVTTRVATRLSVDTWYHVSMILDTANDKVLSGSITPYDGSATTWGEIAGVQGITARIQQLIIADTASPTVAPSILLDNVSLTAIPESTSLLLGSLGLAGNASLLRTQKK